MLRLNFGHRYANLHEVRLIPTKKDIAFVEYLDEASSSVAKDALHNYKLDGENKIKVLDCTTFHQRLLLTLVHDRSRLRGSRVSCCFCCFSPTSSVMYFIRMCEFLIDFITLFEPKYFDCTKALFGIFLYLGKQGRNLLGNTP